MGPRSPTQPVRRSDARRNRDVILGVAREAFADADADVSMAEIARRAGVGPATLYRNFANRRQLLEALYLDEVQGVCDAVDTVAGDTPAERLDAWLRRFFDFFSSKRIVAAELLSSSVTRSPVFDTGRGRVLAVAEPLLAAAQQSGQIKADLRLEQILDAVIAVAKIDRDPRALGPILQVVIDGLRPTVSP